MNKQELSELLECALINCDNVKKMGPVGIELVKMQIQQAIDMLEGEE